jgi:hypothetical protein
MKTRALLGVFVAGAILGAPLAAQADPPIWESNFGSPLGVFDDSTVDVTFGSNSFSFPFEGVTYSGSSILSISSNGFVSLGGDNGDGCCDPNGTTLTGATYPIIAPMWIDLFSTNGGGFGDTYLNVFNDAGGPANDRLVVTWQAWQYENHQTFTFQVQLKSDGTIIFGYNGYVTAGIPLDSVVIGVSPSGGVGDPGSTDLDTAIPFHSDAQGTIYEFFNFPNPALDVDQTNIVWNPDGLNGFRVTREFCKPAFWENNYGSRLFLSDDSTYDTTFGAMGFSFPFQGTTYSGPSVFSISSNGFVSLGGDNGDDCCSGDPLLLTTDGFPRIAPMWTDFRPSGFPGGLGDVFLNTAGGPGGNRVVVTWDTIHYENRHPLAVQLQLLPDGQFMFGYQCWDSSAMTFDGVLTGVSPGNGVADPGSVDLTLTPYYSGSEPTVYDLFAPGVFAFNGQNLVFESDRVGGWHVGREICPTPRIWEPDFGTKLNLTDDSTYATTFGAQNFSFNFEGVAYNGFSLLEISSNGFVSLGGSNSNGCCFADVPTLLGGFPRIAPLWVDLVPGLGDVYLHAFNDWGGAQTDRLVITWDTVFYNNFQSATVQLQLLSNGTIVMGYRCLDVMGGGAKDAITGVSAGSGASDPGGTDLSTVTAIDTGTQGTVYEFFPGPTAIDLSGRNVVLEPNGNGGFHVAPVESAAGTINAAGGVAGITNVLSVNGSTGTPLWRVVSVPQNAPISVTLAAGPAGPATNLNYVLWVWAGSSFHPTEVVSGPNRIGAFLNPTPLNFGQHPQPIRCLHTSTLPPAVCHNVQLLPGPQHAPWTVNRPAGFTHTARFTLQGILRANGAANGLGYSATNAVVIDIP